ncbi:MAG: EthD family reductase [Salinicola sp.]|uniref:EthD family reductase n=1 Tax=Salinicola sp. TaxID=1978524 RepID=UPI001D83217D|nr:EthD family reductase [Salinicola sp.]NRB54459.1 EthD family reductase [Salinicola sp.]
MSYQCVKRLGLVVKKSGMSQEAFEKHWLTVHADLCKQLPGMLRYSVNLVSREEFPEFGYDGFSELWFRSEEELNASLASPEGKTLLADLPNFTESIYPILSHEYQHIWSGQ